MTFVNLLWSKSGLCPLRLGNMICQRIWGKSIPQYGLMLMCLQPDVKVRMTT